jgi:hypothetical protein
MDARLLKEIIREQRITFETEESERLIEREILKKFLNF